MIGRIETRLRVLRELCVIGGKMEPRGARQVAGITVPCSVLAKVASDHLPLIADLMSPCPDSAILGVHLDC